MKGYEKKEESHIENNSRQEYFLPFCMQYIKMSNSVFLKPRFFLQGSYMGFK
jgi:hypothetical protein